MPMVRRRSVMRTVGRTAVMAGTAIVVACGVNRHQQQKYARRKRRLNRQLSLPRRRRPLQAATPTS